MLFKTVFFACLIILASCETSDKKIPTDGVFIIITEKGSGTCWAIDKSHVVTNFHVVGTMNLIVIKGKVFQAGLVNYVNNGNTDVAILEVCNIEESLSPLVISKEKPKIGDSVRVMGFPMSIGPVLSTGIVGGYMKELIITDCDFSAGSSGSPVFNTNWQVVGIATAYKDCGIGSGFGLFQDIKIIKELDH